MQVLTLGSDADVSMSECECWLYAKSLYVGYDCHMMNAQLLNSVIIIITLSHAAQQIGYDDIPPSFMKYNWNLDYDTQM